jgi:serine/threonine protein kinase
MMESTTMSKYESVPVSYLDDAAWSMIDDAIGRLEQTWKSRPDPGFTDLVPPPTNPFRRLVLAELVKVDQECSWRCGTPRKLETYLEAWPELNQHLDTVVDLLNAECLTRANLATPPSHEELHSRFPPEISARIDLTAIHIEAERECRQAGSANPVAVTLSAIDTPCPSQIGRYKPLEQLGAGQFGTVYRCRDEQLERDVAIKLFCDSFLTNNDELDHVLHEAKSAARLRHPGIIAVLDTGRTEDDRGFIVYEFARGSTFRDRISNQSVERDLAVRWVIQVAEALHAAHKCGIVHRDVKPANILIDEADQARLTDFGIAKLDDRFYADDAGTIVGSLAYMSPEQAAGLSHWATPQSDIYSLGVVLYQVLCGRMPFSDVNSDELRKQIIGRAVSPPRSIDDGIPKALENICLKCLAKKPEDRFTTAADLATALRKAMTAHKKRSRYFALTGMVGSTLLIAFAIWSWMTGFPSSVAHRELIQNPPQLTLELVRDGGTHRITQDIGREHLSLRNGDQVRLIADNVRDQYIYMYWYDSEGKPQRLWPESNAQPQAAQSLTLPSTGAYPIEGNRGTECVLLAVAREPLTREQIEILDHTPLVLHPRADGDNAFQVVRSQPHNSATSLDELERGLGKPQPLKLTIDDTNVVKTLASLSMRYCGFLMPHR